MIVAAVQTTSTSDLLGNLKQAELYFNEAVDLGAQLVCFPENFLHLAESREQQIQAAQTLDGPIVQNLRKLARSRRAWLLAGSIQLKTKSKTKLTNTSLLIGPKGQIAARYDKIHLFDAVISADRVYEESKTILPGRKPSLVKTPLGKIGMSVCYDLRFPELYRKYSKSGATILTIPSAFTVPTGQAHWDVLTRTRAIENLCFVIAPAQVGQHNPKRATYGHTRIIDPWGRVLAEKPSGTGIITAELDFDALKKIRLELPALTHRKID